MLYSLQLDALAPVPIAASAPPQSLLALCCMQAGVDPDALIKSHPEYARIHARVAEITAVGMALSVAWLLFSVFLLNLSDFLTG